MKRLTAFLFSVLLLLAALAGCGGTSGGGAEVKADMAALQQAMVSADPSLPELRSLTDRDPGAEDNFPYLSDLPYEKVDGFLLSFSTTGTADEIAVIRVKDLADAAAAKDSLERHRQERLKLFQTYGPTEAARVEKGQVIQDGRYALLLICDDADSVKDAFDSYLLDLTKEG